MIKEKALSLANDTVKLITGKVRFLTRIEFPIIHIIYITYRVDAVNKTYSLIIEQYGIYKICYD